MPGLHMEILLSDSYDIKFSKAGPGKGKAKELRALGRVFTMHHWGGSYDPDPGHAEQVAQALGLGGSKDVCTPYVEQFMSTQGQRSELKERRMEEGHHTRHHACEPHESLALDKRCQEVPVTCGWAELLQPGESRSCIQ